MLTDDWLVVMFWGPFALIIAISLDRRSMNLCSAVMDCDVGEDLQTDFRISKLCPIMLCLYFCGNVLSVHAISDLWCFVHA